MAPTLFSMMFSNMLTDAFHDCDAGFPIRHRSNGKLLNRRRFQAKSNVKTDLLDELFKLDDLAKNAKIREKCKGAWIECHKHVTTMTLQSAQKD